MVVSKVDKKRPVLFLPTHYLLLKTSQMFFTPITHKDIYPDLSVELIELTYG